MTMMVSSSGMRAHTKATHNYTSPSGTSPSTEPRSFLLLTPRSASASTSHTPLASTPITATSPTTTLHSPTSVSVIHHHQHQHLPSPHSTIRSPTNIHKMATISPVSYLPSSALPTASRKRKIIVDHAASTTNNSNKRHRTWTELEYEEMLEEATLLREELELLVAVAADLCRDLSCDPSQVHKFTSTLKQIDEQMASTEDLTEHQVREMCQQMIAMMQYLCQRHYTHFALIDMQDHVRGSRDRFMRFICKYAAMIGLYR